MPFGHAMHVPISMKNTLALNHVYSMLWRTMLGTRVKALPNDLLILVFKKIPNVL